MASTNLKVSLRRNALTRIVAPAGSPPQRAALTSPRAKLAYAATRERGLSRCVPARNGHRRCALPSKKPRHKAWAFRLVGTLTMTYFRAVYPALSSAQRRFTVLFGMGRRGPNALWSSENSSARQHGPMPALPNVFWKKYGFNDCTLTSALRKQSLRL